MSIGQQTYTYRAVERNMMNSVVSAINTKAVEPVEIATEDETLAVNLENYYRQPIETIQDPKWLAPQYQLLYPPNPRFLSTYRLWEKHQRCIWSSTESDPSDDQIRFQRAPKDFQRLVLIAIGSITKGDDIVLGHLDDIDYTPIEVIAMSTDQMAREIVHKTFYSKMLEISRDADYYRSQEFIERYMGHFEEWIERYETIDDIRVKLFMIMLCENILFAPTFQIICYMATKGYSPKVSDGNALAMRDEYLHYLNARDLLSTKVERRLCKKLARKLLNEMVDNVRKFVHLMFDDCNDYAEDSDGINFNRQHVLRHLDYVVYHFMYENCLFLTDDNEEDEMSKHPGNIDDPAEVYMKLPSFDTKINLMEGRSTIYTIEGDTAPINMVF